MAGLRRVVPLPVLDRRLMRELRSLRHDRFWAGSGVPHGDGAPVLIVGGFGAPPIAMRPLAEWLGRIGYRPHIASLHWGLDCAERSATALEEKLLRLAHDERRTVVLFAHSRGGQFARVAAIRQLDAVAGLVTAGTPFELFALHKVVQVQVALIAALGTAGVPNFASFTCLHGACCRRFRNDLKAPWPREVPITCIYSPEDRTVRSEACVDEAARAVPIEGGHLAMIGSRDGFHAIGEALAETARHSAQPTSRQQPRPARPMESIKTGRTGRRASAHDALASGLTVANTRPMRPWPP